MWIRDVDFPEALLDAHRAGKLVIFVGAGASRDSPSDLPDFRTLTADIALDAGEEVSSSSDLGQLDDLLHDLSDDRLDKAPTAFARLIAHVLRSTELPFHDHYFLAKIVPRLRQAADPDVLKAIIEEAMRLGCANAAEWLSASAEAD